MNRLGEQGWWADQQGGYCLSPAVGRGVCPGCGQLAGGEEAKHFFSPVLFNFIFLFKLFILEPY